MSDKINSKWALGFHDRGMGHGDFGVIVDGTSELVFGLLDKDLAEHVIEIHNKDYKRRMDDQRFEDAVQFLNTKLGKPATVQFSVNGREVATDKDVLSYEEVVEAAGYDPKRILTVIYEYTHGTSSGSLCPGQKATVQEGTRFHVADTSNA